MKQKKILVMTSFGPVPFDAVKEYFPKEVVKEVEAEINDLESEDSTNLSLNSCINSIANKMGWKPAKVAGYLDNLWQINPASVFTMLLREAAIELDKKYKDHISNCKELFVISMTDGRIHKMPRAYIKNFRNFSAFRTEEDAKIACNILRNELKEMFKDCGK